MSLALKPELYLQRSEKDIYFSNSSTVDIYKSIGADVKINYHSVGLEVGPYSTVLGFNKNNRDTANTFFASKDRRQTYVIDKIKYRAVYAEVPFSLFYRIKHKRLNFIVGLTYSVYWKRKSYIKAISYYEYNIEKEQQIDDIKAVLIQGAKDSFNSISPFFALENRWSNFALTCKVGLRGFTSKYYEGLIGNPVSI